MFESNRFYFLIIGHLTNLDPLFGKFFTSSLKEIFVVTLNRDVSNSIECPGLPGTIVTVLSEEDPQVLAQTILQQAKNYLEPVTVLLAPDVLASDKRQELYFALQKEGQQVYLLDDTIAFQDGDFIELSSEDHDTTLFERIQKYED